MEAASPKLPREAINWNGDVWKAIHHLRKYKNYFECFTLDFDEGIGVLRIINSNYFKIINEIMPDAQIKDLTYNDLVSNRKDLIGLRKYEFSKNY